MGGMEPWRVLGIDAAATPLEIDAAYKARARLLHPDVNQATTPAEQTRRNAAMAELNAARDAMRGRAATRPKVPTRRPAEQHPTGQGDGGTVDSRRSGPPPGPTARTAPPRGVGTTPGAGRVGEGARPGGSSRSAPTAGPRDHPEGPPYHGAPTDPAATGFPAARGLRAAVSRWQARDSRAGGGLRSFVMVAAVGVCAAAMIIGGLLLVVGVLDALGSKAPAPGRAPGSGANYEVGDCVNQVPGATEAVRVGCDQAHLGRVEATVPRAGACPGTSELEVTVDGDPVRYCLDADT
jgi:hypothetical protein